MEEAHKPPLVRMSAAVVIAIVFLVAAIIVQNFYLSLALGVFGAGTFVYAIMQLLAFRRALAEARKTR